MEYGDILTIPDPFCRCRQSPEATPEGNTAEKIVPEVALSPLPESEKEDKPPSEDDTDTEDSDLKDGLSEGEGGRQQEEEEEEEEEEGAKGAVVSDIMPSPVEGANEVQSFPNWLTNCYVCTAWGRSKLRL